MTTYRLALIGFGNVGQGLAKILLDRGPLAGKAV
jgi:homoserine dehydrogenase